VPRSLSLVARGRGDLPLFDLGLAPTVDAVVTGRRGGVSPSPYDSLNLGDHVGDDPRFVEENRRRVASAMGVDLEHLVTLRQVHGSLVHDVDAWRGEVLEGDALITTRDDVALCVMVADCVPLLVVDGDGSRVGVVHAGWRGLRDGVIGATLAHFAASRVRVVIGPHVSWRRYQVGPEVAEHFADVPGACRPDEGDRRRLDLGAIALAHVLDAGVLEDHVTTTTPGTDDGATFFSDRFARPCGRFALVVRRTSYDSRVREGSR
jgi:YfiH family protein